MAYEPKTTPGGNLYLGGGGTFPQLQAGLQAMAENRDLLDNGIRDALDQGDVGTLASAKEYTDGQRWLRLPLGSEIGAADRITQSGVYPVTGATAVANLGIPGGAEMCAIAHYEFTVDYAKQVYVPRSTGKIMHRFRGAGGWSAWGRTDTETLADAKQYTDDNKVSIAPDPNVAGAYIIGE